MPTQNPRQDVSSSIPVVKPVDKSSPVPTFVTNLGQYMKGNVDLDVHKRYTEFNGEWDSE